MQTLPRLNSSPLEAELVMAPKMVPAVSENVLTINSPNSTDNAIVALFSKMELTNNQLEVQERKTKKLAKASLLKMMGHLEGLMEDNKNLQLANIQQQEMLISERMLHQKQIKVYEEQAAQDQNEIAKLRQELINTKREAEERIQQTIKEKEEAVLFSHKTAEARVVSLKLEQQSIWLTIIQYVKKRYELHTYRFVAGIIDRYTVGARQEAQDLFFELKKMSGIRFKNPGSDVWGTTLETEPK